MKILMLSDVYFPRVNGVSTSIRTLALGLRRLGHEVTLVAPDYGQGADPDDFEIIRLRSRRIFFDPEDRLMTQKELRRARRQLASRSWDVIHVHTPFQAHRLGVQLKRATATPTVETYHTYFEPYVAHYLPWLPAPLLRFAARRLSRTLCNAVDHLVVPTTEIVEVLDRYGIATASTVIPTGIDPEEFAGGDGSRFRRRHGIAPERPTLVTISRLALEKNIGFLLTVTQRLTAKFPDLLLVIAGEGPDGERLRREVATLGLGENVRFFGNLDRAADLLDCYKAADLFVFASPTETQGLVLLEAMALGVPIVSTAVMGTVSVLAQARSARISAQDPGEFAEHVAQLLRSPSARQVLAQAGPTDAAGWHAPTLVARVADLYRRLAGRDHQPAANRLLAAGSSSR